MTILVGTQVLRGSAGGGGASLPSAAAEGQSIISTGAGASYVARQRELPASLRDAAVWLDPDSLAEVDAGTACGVWPSLQGGVATLFEGTPPTRSTAGAGGLDFSAAAGCLRVEGVQHPATSAFTVAVLLTPGPTGAKQWWVHWGVHAGIFANSLGVVNFEGGGALSSSVTPSDAVVAVATFDGTTKRIYLDGEEVASGAASISVTPNPFAIGARGDGISERFSGIVHAAGGWIRALSAGEVTTLTTWLASRLA